VLCVDFLLLNSKTNNLLMRGIKSRLHPEDGENGPVDCKKTIKVIMTVKSNDASYTSRQFHQLYTRAFFV